MKCTSNAWFYNCTMQEHSSATVCNFSVFIESWSTTFTHLMWILIKISIHKKIFLLFKTEKEPRSIAKLHHTMYSNNRHDAGAIIGMHDAGATIWFFHNFTKLGRIINIDAGVLLNSRFIREETMEWHKYIIYSKVQNNKEVQLELWKILYTFFDRYGWYYKNKKNKNGSINTIKYNLIPEPTARSAVPGVSPGRGY